MKLAAPIFAAAISLAISNQQVKAPEIVAFKREAKGAKFLGAYDRIQKEEPVRMQRCKTPGTVWYHDACWRPERILKYDTRTSPPRLSSIKGKEKDYD